MQHSTPTDQQAAAERQRRAIAEAEALLAKYGVPAVNGKASKAAHTSGKRALRRQATKG